MSGRRSAAALGIGLALFTAVALEGAPGPPAALAIAASVALGLAAGLFAPAEGRAAGARGAALGSVVDALLRALLLWRSGGAAALSIGAIVPPAMVGLSAVLAALLTGRWWRALWRLDAAGRLGRT